MSDLIYCVRVIRKDHPKPSEEDYYYLNRADAELHLQMFKDDDPVYACGFHGCRPLAGCE